MTAEVRLFMQTTNLVATGWLLHFAVDISATCTISHHTSYEACTFIAHCYTATAGKGGEWMGRARHRFGNTGHGTLQARSRDGQLVTCRKSKSRRYLMLNSRKMNPSLVQSTNKKHCLSHLASSPICNNSYLPPAYCSRVDDISWTRALASSDTIIFRTSKRSRHVRVISPSTCTSLQKQG